jgi:hypothetical protein
MKKSILLIVSLLVLVWLGWFAFSLMKQKPKSDSELIEFAVADTASIDKIVIQDPNFKPFTLQRSGKIWTDGDGGCINQQSVQFILETFKKIEFKGYLPDSSQDKFEQLMSTQHTKVMIYKNGEWIKTWYLGPPAQDHYGQIMLLDDATYGKSAHPVIMKIRGENGIIEPRFFADPRKWMCTNIFSLSSDKIASISVKFNDKPEMSFSLNKNGGDIQVFQQNQRLTINDTARVYRYLQNYKKIHFELPNYELNTLQLDSLKKTVPFAVLTVKETNGKSTILKMFRIKTSDKRPNEFGEIVDNDLDRFWCQVPNGSIVKCQYFVFNPLLYGNVYFPMISTVPKAP